MCEKKIKSILMQMKMGEEWDEREFIRRGITNDELDYMVDLGYLRRLDKEVGQFMSDNHYLLTESGKNFAWN